jgi:hypothetical protein
MGQGQEALVSVLATRPFEVPVSSGTASEREAGSVRIKIRFYS